MDQTPPPARRTGASKQAAPPPPPTLPEVPLGRRQPQVEALAAFTAQTQIHGSRKDLSGKSKVIFFTGRGRTGKTTLVRYFAERLSITNSKFSVLDGDKTNPVLDQYFDAERPDSFDDASMAAWIAGNALACVGNGAHLIVDLGGGDTSLAQLVQVLPNLVAELEAGDGAVVVCCTLGTAPEDLSPLSNLYTLGFRPTATALLFSQAALTTPLTEASFAAIQTHSFYKRLLDEQGAVPILVPALSVAAAVEARRLNFQHACDGATPPGGFPLGLYERFVVRDWMVKMEKAFAPVASWFR